MNAAQIDDNELHFHTAKHKVIGMDGSLAKTLRDNAPRVVGGLRLASILMASVGHPLLGLHALFVLGSEAVLLLFGNKQSVEKYKSDEEKDANPIAKAVQPHKYPLESSAALDVLGEISHLILGISFVFNLDISGWESILGEEASHAGHDHNVAVDGESKPGYELRQHGDHYDWVPKGEYPPRPIPGSENYVDDLIAWTAEVKAIDAARLEAASAPSSDPHAGHHHPTGIALLAHGVLGIAAHLPLWIFGPEKAGHNHAGHLGFAGDEVNPDHVELEFESSESKVVGTQGGGLWGWFKEHQVIISSVLQVGIGITMIAATGMPDMYQYAGVPLIAAGALQALLVTKRDFSADAEKEDHQEQQPPHTYGNHVQSVMHNGKLAPHEQSRHSAVPEYGFPA